MSQNGNGNRRSWVEYLEYLSDIGLETLPRREVEEEIQPEIKVPPAVAALEGPSRKTPDSKGTPSLFSPTSTPKQKGDRNLAEIQTDIGDCQRCKLYKNRTRIVFGSGNPQAKVMFVGEGPGADEDKQGVPFVGKAGQLLTKIIEAIRFSREEVYIANVVKCRPPDNRTPEEDEIKACEGFLFRQIEVIRPWIICALGAPSSKTLLGVKSPIGQLRGRWFQCRGAMLIPTFHPSYLLRNPAAKKEVWEDVKSLRQRYDQMCSERNPAEAKNNPS
jgi:uracil-DNA glycosylase